MSLVEILGILGFSISLIHLLWEAFRQIVRLSIDECIAQWVTSDVPDFGYLFTFTLANKTSRNLPIISIDLKLSDNESWSCQQSTRDEIKELNNAERLPTSAFETVLPINLPPYSSKRVSLLFRTQGTPETNRLHTFLFHQEGRNDVENYKYIGKIRNSKDNGNEFPEVSFELQTPWKTICRKVKVTKSSLRL